MGAIPAAPHIVVAVVVSYNRRSALTDTLTAILDQDRPPERVVLIDNASTDGTPVAIREHFGEHVDLVALDVNTGGAGGFALGLARALRSGADLVWLMDDDAVPEPSALAALVEAYDGYPGVSRPALVASHVVWTDGATHRMNMPRRRRDATPEQHRAAAVVGCSPIRTASFVSVLIDGEAARAEDPVLADYFLWNDDVEYTARLLRHRVGLRCPASVTVHQTATNYNTLAESGDRLLLDVRNMLWFVGRCRGLTIRERAFFVAITARRWLRTLQRSSNRVSTVATIGRGVIAAARRGPRPTREVLEELGVGADWNGSARTDGATGGG